MCRARRTLAPKRKCRRDRLTCHAPLSLTRQSTSLRTRTGPSSSIRSQPMQHTRDRHGIRQQLADMPPRPLGIDRSKVSSIEQGIPRRERRRRFVILRTGHLEFLDLTTTAQVVFIFIDLSQPRAVFQMLLVALLPVRFRRMRGETAIGTGKLDFFDCGSCLSVCLGVRQARRLGLFYRMVETDRARRQGFDDCGLLTKRRNGRRFKRMEKVVWSVQWRIRPWRWRGGSERSGC